MSSSSSTLGDGSPPSLEKDEQQEIPSHEGNAAQPLSTIPMDQYPRRQSSASLEDQTAGRRSSNALELLKNVTTTNPAHPILWPTWKKWGIVIVYNLLQVFVTMSSTTYVSAEYLVQEKYGSSVQVTTLGQSMFIVGNAVGPAFLGPLSDIGGRKWVYCVSIFVYAMLNIGTALSYNLPMLIIFQFLSGAAGSTALSNVAGTISDLFGDSDGAGQPMALFVAAANIGPSIGSPIGEWISENPNMGLNWIFWINVIFGGFFSAIMVFVPETLPRLVIAKSVKRNGSTDANALEIAETKVSIWREMRFVTTMAFRIMLTEPIVICLAIYNGWAYGLLFLYLDGVYPVFAVNNNLSDIGADLTYLNFAVAVSIMFCFFPVQTYLYTRDRKKNNGVGRPEARFLTSLVTVWLFPISLFWFAFTSNGSVNYWCPLIAGAVLGFCDPLLYCAMLSYITDTYPNLAASAIAAFLIPSFLLAAGFAHIGIVLFNNLGTTWAMACVAFLSLGIVALVYVLYFFGPRIRKMSKLAKNSELQVHREKE